MRRAVSLPWIPVLVLVAAAAATAPASARRPAESYLAFAGGVDLLTGDVGGDVIARRSNGNLELAVGHQFGDRLLVEFSYGILGRREQEPPIGVLALGELPPAYQRAYRVQANPMFLRARYAHSGQRTEYLKPELSLALGFVQVSRLLRNVPFIPPEGTSQLLPSLEVGAAALFVFSKTFMMTAGVRYRLTEREPIVDATDHLDGFVIGLGLRSFLPSPRDVAEP